MGRDNPPEGCWRTGVMEYWSHGVLESSLFWILEFGFWIETRSSITPMAATFFKSKIRNLKSKIDSHFLTPGRKSDIILRGN